MSKKVASPPSENLLKAQAIEREKIYQYFVDNIEDMVPMIEDFNDGYAMIRSPFIQMKMLFLLARQGKDTPRWIARIKALEARLENVRKATVND